MKVYKFGGASVKDASGIRNLRNIITHEKENLVIVVSAFGKTTNAFEKALKAWFCSDASYNVLLDEIYRSHSSVTDELFGPENEIRHKLDSSFSSLKKYLLNEKKGAIDFEYDQIVSYGEIWSTIIVEGFLKASGMNTEWIDIRRNLITDDRFRDAGVMWEESSTRIRAIINSDRSKIFVTQGFIGGTIDGKTTTLGREGSDYTAAILANILDAEAVVVWKDVPGILNSDPKWLPDAQKLDEISYKEAVEMSFSGAKVIHPKTIKPLQNKNIPLFVKSFLEPSKEGTVIKADATLKKILPVFVKKEDQILISVHPKNFSFVMGDNLSLIFQSFMSHGIKVNLVEASAIIIDVCVDDERDKVDLLIEDLKKEYSAVYNENVEMLSIRHYNMEAIDRMTSGREILLEQRTRSTVRFVVRKNGSKA
jgi:aspartate kinase